jgi:hypothetical protein
MGQASSQCGTNQHSRQSSLPEQETSAAEMLGNSVPKGSRPRTKRFVVRVMAVDPKAKAYVDLWWHVGCRRGKRREKTQKQ